MQVIYAKEKTKASAIKHWEWSLKFDANVMRRGRFQTGKAVFVTIHPFAMSLVRSEFELNLFLF